MNLKENSNRYHFLSFAFISGFLSLNYNAILMIAPLRMYDQGLNYGVVGSAMSSMAIGILIIKLLIGRISDVLGQKSFIVISLFGMSITTILLAFSSRTIHYIVCMCGTGLFWGVFTSVNNSYVIGIADEEKYGKIFGFIEGISSILACFGGLLSGFFYHRHQDKFLLITFAVLLIIIAILSIIVIPSMNSKPIESDYLSLRKSFRKIHKYIFIFMFVSFFQSFVTSPLWNFIIPMHCYGALGFTAATVGILMSLDELISSPTYVVVGYIVDKVNIQRFNSICFLLTGLSGLLMIFAQSTFIFMIFFLMCSVTICCTFVGIPKHRRNYIRESQKGFELSLISVSASLGNTVGSKVMGHLSENYSVKYSIAIFIFFYWLISLLLFALSIHEKNRKNL